MIYDYQKAAKTPLKGFMLRSFLETWKLQEQVKQQHRNSIHQLVERVTRLEKESWDREGAVEDMGGR